MDNLAAGMTPQEQAQARQVERLARWTLVTLAKVEQGLLPVQVLTRTVEPQVLTALGPIAVNPEQTRLRPDVGRVRVQLTDERTAHAAAVARRPDGRHAGYVLELNRDSLDGRWRVCELTRADERRLVGPEHRLVGRADRDGFQHLPADLDPLIASVEQARDDAQRHIDLAAERLRRIIQQLEQTPHNRNDRFNRLRTALRMEEHLTTRTQGRWQLRLQQLDETHRELTEVRELRALKTAVRERDPLLNAGSKDRLERLLGPPPDDPAQRADWRARASTVERARQTLGVEPDAFTREADSGMLAAEAGASGSGPRRGHTLDDVQAARGWTAERELER